MTKWSDIMFEGLIAICFMLIVAGFGIYVFLYFLPQYLMLLIQDTMLSNTVQMFNAQPILIPVIGISLLLIYSSPVFSSDHFNTGIKKLLGVVFCALPVLLFLTFVHFTSEEKYVKEIFNEKYEELVTANVNFKNSIIGKELRLAIDSNDYTKINEYYPKSSRFVVNKKVEGIPVEQVIDKQALVNGIDVPVITEKFKLLLKDNYITLNEYENFKKETLDYLITNNYKLSAEKNIFLNRL